MQNFKKISVIIVNFRSRHYLERCLASIYQKLENQNFEIIVVNNDKQEKLLDIREKYPEVKILNQAVNIGYGRGVNLGAKEASGEILLLLNPDTELLSNLEFVIRVFFQNREIGALSPRLIDKSGKTQEWIAGKEINLSSTLLNNLGLNTNQKIWESPKQEEVDWVSGAALFIRRDIFEMAGGFDEKIFMYFEDVDLCLRLRDFGKKIIYLPDERILHHGGRSFIDKKLKKSLYYHSQDYYFRKHFGKTKAWLLKVLRKIFVR
jgi:hypothetical protein